MKGIFLDLETNGLDPRQHTPIELAFIIRHLKTGEILEEYETLILPTEKQWELSDPESLKVNGFKLELLERAPSLGQVEKEVCDIFSKHKIARGKAFFICQNPSFDRAFFAQIVPVYKQEKFYWPYHWLDLASMYWGQTAKGYLANPGKEPLINLSKNFIAQKLGIPPEVSPHKALNGVKHLLSCYEKIIGFSS
ncbi:MAG: 3'-5' exonuclease [Chlamydiales bacterium]|nr:3'-5' exonuclease [Chlamydiales bacterium]